MDFEEIKLIENQIFTRLVIDLLKEQRAQGIKDFLLDKYSIDNMVKDLIKKYFGDSKVS